MSNPVKFVCGIDMGQDSFVVCLMSVDEQSDLKVKATHKYPNTYAGFAELSRWLKNHVKNEAPIELLMEATGIYHERLALYLQEGKHTVKVVLPNKARKFMEAIGHKSKNDKIDAKGLAVMCAQIRHQSWQPMSKFFYELRQLTRQHQALQEAKTILVNQQHALQYSPFPSAEVKKQMKKTIALLEKQTIEIKQAIEKHLSTEKSIQDRVENICQIKGLGLLSAATIIAETNGFTLFESIGQLVSYAGYDVVENQSGKHVGKTKISKKGNSHIRRILHMPALNVVRHDVYPFKQLYQRIFERTGIPMKGYTAVQKKLLVIIYTLWKKNEPFKADSFANPQAKSEIRLKKVASKNEATQDEDPSKVQRLSSLSLNTKLIKKKLAF